MIVPVLNEAVALPELLMMLRSLPVDEVVLVDGGSQDATVELLQRSGFVWLVAAGGRAGQMNAGAARCRSDTLLFLHADTCISSSNIAHLRTTLADVGIQSGRFDLQLSGNRWQFRLISTMINLRSRLTKVASGDQALFVRRSLFVRLGGFPDLPLMEDIALSRRLKRIGGVVCLRDRVITSSRRWSQGGVVRTILLMWALRLGFYAGVPSHRLAGWYRQVR
ncbi:MAG: TIGR04283 family arsenosugar biosynthesis glycosyltransferase [Mariprofundales bacterium]|nr:TIGR04283 family arsenosugar biosynthesis glycosyltransferase [Mariprofundales bacterium]